MAEHPFQARDHGSGILEIIGTVSDMGADHPAVVALEPLARKSKGLIFNLETASLQASALRRLADVAIRTKLRVIAPHPGELNFAAAGIKLCNSVSEALMGIKGEATLEIIMTKVQELPQLNSSAYEYLQKLNDPNTDFTIIADAISSDPALSAQIFKTANSAFFMRRNKVDTLSAAISFLGLEGVKQILVFHIFKGLTGYFQVQKEVLDHARATAHLAAQLATYSKYPRPTVNKIKLGGLLHDFGRMILAFFFSTEYEQVRKLTVENQKCTHDAELMVFGIDHQRLGKALAEKWGFPEYLRKIIADHHTLAEPTWEELTGPVFCANGYLNQVENTPYTPYLTKLRGFLKQLPEEQQVTTQELLDFMKKEHDEYLAAEHSQEL